MHPGFRDAFNAAFTDDLYRRQARDLARRAGAEAGFRLAETPVFLTRGAGEAPRLRGARRSSRSSRDPANARGDAALRPGGVGRAREWTRSPSLAQVDLAVVEDPDGPLEPKLIELQGFPSLSAFEVLQADAWSDALEGIPGLPPGRLEPLLLGPDPRRLPRPLPPDRRRRATTRRRVVLLDLHPETQKTYVDFAATRDAPRRRARLPDGSSRRRAGGSSGRRTGGASRSSGSTTASSSTS